MGERLRLRIKEITEDMVWERVPKRIQESHKGTYGKVLCVAGSSRFRGAAALCTEGALRSGCGIVTLATVEPVFASVQPRMPEAILMSCSRSDMPNEKGEYFGGIDASNASKLRTELDNGYSALVIGPGMGNTDDTAALTKALVTDTTVTAVLDADALNALARAGKAAVDNDRPTDNGASDTETRSEASGSNLTILPRAASGGSVIITPHPGELARLCGCTISHIKQSPEEIAVLYAIKNNCVVVLKEHRTIIATPDGHIYRNTSGNSGLARGGSGDILAGMIGSLAAQGLSAEDAAICGVWLHGRAAERCSARRSQTCMLPHDIFEDLGIMMREHNR